MKMTQAEWYAQKNKEEKERVDAAHELRMAQRRASMATDPGGFNPWEKKAVDDYFRQKEEARQFDEQQKTARGEWGFMDANGEYHAGGRSDVAENERFGREAVAKINAEAAKYGADKTFEGIKAQAEATAETARQKAAAEQEIAKRNAEVAEGASEREWGYIDGNGNYVPGGRVRQAEAQGEAAAKAAAANNQARIEQEKIKAQAKVAAAGMMNDTRIKTAVAGNVMFANNPEKAQEMVEALVGQGLSAEAVGAVMEAINKSQEAQGGGNPPPAETQKTRSEQIKDKARAKFGD